MTSPGDGGAPARCVEPFGGMARLPLHALCVAVAIGLPIVAGADVRGDAGREGAAPRDARLQDPHGGVLATVDPKRLPPGARSPAERDNVATEPAPLGHGTAPRFFEDVPAADGARGGLRLEYTIDPELDTRVRAMLERDGVALAHVILMDPANGEVFAYVSTDPERFPATRAYPTASLMKVVTAAAVLRSAPEVIRRNCRYVGSPWELRRAHLDPPTAGGRHQSFRRAIAVSNNQCFARFAVHDLGREALVAEMERLGLLEAPAPLHPPGRIETIGGALGLGYLGSGMAGSFVTPLAAVRLAALLAEGRVVRPWWVARAWDAEGEPRAVPGRETPRLAATPQMARTLREMLVDVTERGTARRAFQRPDGERVLGPVRVAGKTGTVTGHDPGGRYQWFIGVAPADAPRVAIATLVVSNPPGGPSASEVAASSLEEVFCEGERCGEAGAERLYARIDEHTRRAERERADRDARERARLAEAGAQLAALREAERQLRAAAELDRMPRPVEATGFDFPRRLRSKEAHGEIVLELDLDAEGDVLDVRIASSDLPHFDEYVSNEVRGWRFTPPTRFGRPVPATARFPIAIDIH